MLVCVFFCACCTRDRGCSAHPAFPAPSYFSGRRFLYDSGVARRGIAKPHPAATQRKTVSQYGRSILIWHKMKPGSGGARPRDLTEENLPVRHYDWIAHFGRRTPDKIAAVDLASQRRLSYAEFDARISRLATHLRDGLKVVRGDRVAVLALNTTDTLEVQFACGRIGAVFLPLNTRLTVPELQFIVGDSSPKVMIHDTDLAEVALTVAKLCNVASALLLGAGGTYEAAIAASQPLDKAETVTLDDISTIMYTSGTTGQPKGAIITHGMTFWNCVNLGGPAYISPSSVLLTLLPLFHTPRPPFFTHPVP